jgi:hypothetical protein
MTQADRAQKRISGAAIDVYECRYFTKGSARRLRATAKRETRKARRRIDRDLARREDS